MSDEDNKKTLGRHIELYNILSDVLDQYCEFNGYSYVEILGILELLKAEYLYGLYGAFENNIDDSKEENDEDN